MSGSRSGSATRIAASRRAGRTPVLLSLHSFTPRLSGRDRPWQVGVLWRGDDRLAAPLLAALRARGDLVVGDNEPYSGALAFGYTIEFHAQRSRLPHLMLELRQDEIDIREETTRQVLDRRLLRHSLKGGQLPWRGADHPCGASINQARRVLARQIERPVVSMMLDRPHAPAASDQLGDHRD